VDCAFFALHAATTKTITNRNPTISGPAALLIVENDLRGSFVDLKLGAHLLDL
jgi:hypothetical protein